MCPALRKGLEDNERGGGALRPCTRPPSTPKRCLAMRRLRHNLSGAVPGHLKAPPASPQKLSCGLGPRGLPGRIELAWLQVAIVLRPTGRPPTAAPAPELEHHAVTDAESSHWLPSQALPGQWQSKNHSARTIALCSRRCARTQHRKHESQFGNVGSDLRPVIEKLSAR